MSIGEIVPRQQPNPLATVPTNELRDRLASALTKTAEGLAEMASIVHELEARGEDLSSLRLAVIPYLRRIASGQLLPQVVVNYAGSPRLLSAVSMLPIEDQSQLLDRGVVSVAVVGQNGEISTRQIDPRALSPRDITKVFTPGGILSPEKQVVERRTRRESTPRKYNVRVNRRTRTVLIGKAVVPVEEILAAISEAAGYQGEIDPKEHTGNAPRTHAFLTVDEKERLVALSKATGLPEWELVRRAILAWLV